MSEARRLFRGFTLIELLVVLAIIAVLAGVAVPSYLGYKARARDSAAQEDGGTYRISQEAIMAQFGAYSLTASCLCGFGYGPLIVQGEAIGLAGLFAAAPPSKHSATFFHPRGDTSYFVTQAGVGPGAKCVGADCAAAGWVTSWPVAPPLVGGTTSCPSGPCPPGPYDCPPPGKAGLGCPAGCGTGMGIPC